MLHSEYKNIVPGAKRAYLFVHGIIGTPDHFDKLIPMLPEDVTVWNLLLDGHGKGPTDFSRASMKKWRATVKSALRELAASHDEIFVVAHSLGTLLTMEEALVNEKIVKVDVWLFFHNSKLTNSISFFDFS